MNAVNIMKKQIKTEFPEVQVKIRTINFTDLARCSKQFATVTGLTPENFKRIAEIVRDSGLILDIQ